MVIEVRMMFSLGVTDKEDMADTRRYCPDPFREGFFAPAAGSAVSEQPSAVYVNHTSKKKKKERITDSK